MPEHTSIHSSRLCLIALNSVHLPGQQSEGPAVHSRGRLLEGFQRSMGLACMRTDQLMGLCRGILF